MGSTRRKSGDSRASQWVTAAGAPRSSCAGPLNDAPPGQPVAAALHARLARDRLRAQGGTRRARADCYPPPPETRPCRADMRLVRARSARHARERDDRMKFDAAPRASGLTLVEVVLVSVAPPCRPVSPRSLLCPYLSLRREGVTRKTVFQARRVFWLNREIPIFPLRSSPDRSKSNSCLGNYFFFGFLRRPSNAVVGEAAADHAGVRPITA